MLVGYGVGSSGKTRGTWDVIRCLAGQHSNNFDWALTSIVHDNNMHTSFYLNIV
jgi:hypothetical protein